MRLQTEPPPWVLHHAGHRLGSVAARTWLQEEMRGGQALVLCQVLPLVHHLHLVDMLQPQLSALLGRAGHPVYAFGQGACAVGLYADVLACAVQHGYKTAVYPQRRLSAGEYHHACRVFLHFGQDVIVAHHGAAFVLCVAEGTLEVAPRKAHKHRGRAGVETFALQAVENLVNLSHTLQCFLPTPALPP